MSISPHTHSKAYAFVEQGWRLCTPLSYLVELHLQAGSAPAAAYVALQLLAACGDASQVRAHLMCMHKATCTRLRPRVVVRVAYT